MLDLNKLEKELDNLLDNESDESLSAWLLGKRSQYITDFVGQGKIEYQFPISGEAVGAVSHEFDFETDLSLIHI